MNIDEIYVSACRGAFDRNTTMVRLVDWLENVRPEHPRNDWEKKQLPAIMPHGLFATRRQDSFTRHSGLIQVDIDAKHQKPEFNAEEVIELMQTDDRIAVAGLSCSGNGVYALVAIEIADMKKDCDMKDEHVDIADKVREWVEFVFPVRCDWPVMGNLSSLRFASPYAPYINLDVEPLKITL